MLDRFKVVGAAAVSLITAGIAIWWLWLVAARLGVKPEVDADGTVVLDQFQRAKDILIVVLPLFSAAIAFWVGSQGTVDAKKEASEAKDKLEAVLDVSSAGMLEQAKQRHPEAFSA